MIRTALFALAFVATAAAAIAAVHPVARLAPTNITVVHKNSEFPILGPIVVEQCKVEDCSAA